MKRSLMVLALAVVAAPLAVHGADVITMPAWLKKPTQEDMEGVWPAQAYKNGIDGLGIIGCEVTVRGLLEKCEVVEEKPAGSGYGAAALALAPRFLMKPKMVNGVAVPGGTVRIPITFTTNGGGGVSHSVKVMRTAPWAETPTAAQFAEAFPKSARGKVDAGHVVVRCKIAPTGALRMCEALSEEPKIYGFRSAALGLTEKFKVRLDPNAHWPSDTYVDIPFDFRSPDKPTPTKITSPLWLQTASPAYAAQVFPAKARAAGLVSGRAVLDCTVTHDGKLADCSSVREEPAGLGFGEAAVTIAGVMGMNPWTTEGTPVDGVRYQVAIRIDLPPEPPKAPAGAPSP